jgi:acyl-coenzyme A thioesterase PaaI-like protein
MYTSKYIWTQYAIPPYTSAGLENRQMADAIAHLQEGGWTRIADDGFVGLAGPYFVKETGKSLSFCFPTDPKHRNRSGVLQGGALVTFADRAMGTTVRAATNANRTATVQLNAQFVDAVKIGEVVETTPEIVHVTRSLAFINAVFRVGPRTVASANGIWKLFRSGTPTSSIE